MILRNKRKHQSDESKAEDASFQVKRRRQRPIETVFAALSLHASPSTSPTSPLPVSPLPDLSNKERPLPPPPQPVTSPPEPEIRDVPMKTSSWYEPERDRIVVLDLDSESECDDEESAQEKSNGGLKVSSLLLARLKEAQANGTLPKDDSNRHSMQLVLFKPSPWLTPSSKDASSSSPMPSKSTPASEDAHVENLLETDIESDEPDLMDIDS